jgi:hypothetical protein
MMMRGLGLAGALLLCAAPGMAGEILVPLSAGVAADGTAYATRVWVTNVGSTARRWTPSFIALGVDGTKAAAGSPVTVNPGATVPVANLAPAGKSGMLYVNGAPQLVVTARLEGTGKDGSPRAAVAGPVVTGHDLAASGGTLQLHGLSHRQGGLITDLYLINAARQPAQCTVNAFRDDGSTIAAGMRYTLPALSVQVVAGALAQYGASAIDEARLAVSCDQAFYAYARVSKAGSGELNLMTPPRTLGRPATVP